MNILLAIDEAAGLRVLKQLTNSHCKIIGILTSPPSFKNNGIYKLAKRSHISVHPGSLAREAQFADWIKKGEVDLLISVHFSYIFCEKVIQSPKVGSFNLHPGPLPQYAGLNPVSWAIFNGEKNYGVTLHWVTPQIDGGPIAYHAPVKIEETDSAYQLMSKCVEEGVKLVNRLVETAAQDQRNIPAVIQNRNERHYYDRTVPNNGWIDWNQPAQHIFNFVRACDFSPFSSPWGFPKSRLNGEVVEFLKLKSYGRPNQGVPGSVSIVDDFLLVSASDESLVVELIKTGSEIKRPLEVLRQGDVFASPLEMSC